MKLYRFIASVVVILAILSAHASVPYDFTVGGVYYFIDRYNADEVAVTYRAYVDKHNSYKGDVTVPETVSYQGKTYTVTSINMLAFRYCEGLTSVSLPSTLRFIDSYAFDGCTALKSVVIPAAVESIAHGAFRNCYAMTSVTFEGGVDELMNSVFENCSKLTSVTLPEGTHILGSDVFNKCSALAEINLPMSLEEVGNGTFNGTPWLSTRPDGPLYVGGVLYSYVGDVPANYSLEIPEGIVSVSPSAFFGKTNLTALRLPSTLKVIGSSSFFGTGLAEVTIPASVTTLGSACFAYSYDLKTVNYNAVEATGVENPTYGAFAYCSGIENINIGSIVSRLPESVFAYTGGKLLHVTVPASVKTIAYGAFSNIHTLVSVDLEGVVTIGDKAFNTCEALASIVIPNTTTTIGEMAFQSCSSLVTAIIGTNVTSIGLNAFAYFDKRQGNMVNPKLVKGILLCNADPAGLLDSKLPVRYRLSDLPNLNMMFVHNNVRYVPLSVKDRTCAAIDCIYSPDVTEFEISGKVSYRGVQFSVTQLFTNTLSYNPYIAKVKVNIPDVDIPGYFCRESVNISEVEVSNCGDIGQYAFIGSMCGPEAASVKVNNSGAIGVGAFYECLSIGSVEVGDKVTSLGSSAFYRSFTNASGKVVLNNRGGIGDYCFYQSVGIEGLEVGANVMNIGENAFGYSITQTDAEVELHNSGKIGANAFEACTHISRLYVGPNVNEIGNGAFSRAMSAVDDGATAEILGGGPVGNNAFDRCSSLQTIALSDNITSLGTNVLSNCGRLSSVNLSKRIKALPINAFQNDVALKDVSIPDSVATIGDSAFENSGITKITIPASVMSVGNAVFDNCRSLNTLVINASDDALMLGYSNQRYTGTTNKYGLFGTQPIEHVVIGRELHYDARVYNGYSPFCDNVAIKCVDLGEKVHRTGNYLLRNCQSIEKVSIGRELSDIGIEAFAGCTALRSVRFGSQLTSIGQRAFNACTGLREFGVEAAEPPTCGAEALSGIDKWECTLYVPANSIDAYYGAEQWEEFFFINDIAEMPVESEPIIGDADGDGKVTVTDVVMIVNYILGFPPENFNYDLCDIDGDGSISVADVVHAVNIAISATR